MDIKNIFFILCIVITTIVFQYLISFIPLSSVESSTLVPLLNSTGSFHTTISIEVDILRIVQLIMSCLTVYSLIKRKSLPDPSPYQIFEKIDA